MGNGKTKKPTLKQKKAAKKFLENRGNLGEAMREAGYSEATAKNPKNLTDSKGWQTILNKYLPEDLLAKTHKQSLRATKVKSLRVVGKKKDGSYKFSQTKVPDHSVRIKAVELGYKVRGMLKDTVEHSLDEKVVKFLDEASKLMPKSE